MAKTKKVAVAVVAKAGKEANPFAAMIAAKKAGKGKAAAGKKAKMK